MSFLSLLWILGLIGAGGVFLGASDLETPSLWALATMLTFPVLLIALVKWGTWRAKRTIAQGQEDKDQQDKDNAFSAFWVVAWLVVIFRLLFNLINS